MRVSDPLDGQPSADEGRRGGKIFQQTLVNQGRPGSFRFSSLQFAGLLAHSVGRSVGRPPACSLACLHVVDGHRFVAQAAASETAAAAAMPTMVYLYIRRSFSFEIHSWIQCFV